MIIDFGLPSKITGFYSPQDTPPPLIDVELFKEACLNIESSNEFQLLKFVYVSGAASRSYHFAVVKENTDDKYVQICCNCYFPYIAYNLVSEEDIKNEAILNLPPVHFIDYPRLDSFFTDDFEILTRDFLEVRLEAENARCQRIIRNLTNEEFAQFAYRQPEIIGEIIYNCWD